MAEQSPADPPAAHRLGVPENTVYNAQVFQNASCNWRCWYCFVPFDLLAANEGKAGWLTTDRMISLYRAEATPPIVIDCSGGQPDLIPEWIPWMMGSLTREGLDNATYLWSDDNLSNDYFRRHLRPDQRPLIAPYQRVSEGDVVLLKAGLVRASFRASSVEFVELDDSERTRLVRDCSDAICADEAFWRAREDKQYATLIGISEVRLLTPIRISKSDRRGWLVLRESARDSEQLSLL